MPGEFVGMRIRLSRHSEDVLRRYMKKYNLTNFSEAIEKMCADMELKDK